jgi:transposase
MGFTCPTCLGLQRRVAELRAQVDQLKQQLEEAHRAGKRQAAPFAKGVPKKRPKKPGRKPGAEYGTKAHREPPEHIDTILDAPLPKVCPDCGGPIDETHIAQQYQVEIPRRPIHRQFQVHVGRCRDCHHRVQGCHPLQTSNALGAAAAQLGPDTQAAIVDLNKHKGLSHPKVADCLKTLFGITVTPSGVTHVIQRTAQRCQPIYQQLVHSMPSTPWTVPDETGWRVGGHGAWLHAFVAAEQTIYVVDPTRSSKVAEDLLGAAYDGILIHDGWAPYDRFDTLHQQCVQHLLRRCQHLLETAVGRAARFPRQVMNVLHAALALRQRYLDGEVSDHGLAIARSRLTNRLEVLATSSPKGAANQRLARHLLRHLPEWLTFLFLTELDATNWRAELAIRFGVILRKVWGGNRTWRGAQAQGILMSIWRTCWQRGLSAIEFVSHVLRGSLVTLPLPP